MLLEHKEGTCTEGGDAAAQWAYEWCLIGGEPATETIQIQESPTSPDLYLTHSRLSHKEASWRRFLLIVLSRLLYFTLLLAGVLTIF